MSPGLAEDDLRAYAAELEDRIDRALAELARWQATDANGERSTRRRAVRRILEGKYRAPR